MKTQKKISRKNKKALLRCCDEYVVIFAATLNSYENAQCVRTAEAQQLILQGLAKDVRGFINDVQYLESNFDIGAKQ